MNKKDINIVGIVFGKSVLSDAELAKELGVNIIEVRIDLFEELNISFIKEVLNKIKTITNLPIIGTVRMEKERGMDIGIKFSHEKDRLEIYQEIVNFVDLVDIEYKSGLVKKIVRLAKQANKQSIVSYHNFKKTPGIGYLSKLARKVKKELKADIVKIVTNPRNKLEFFRLLDFTKRCRYKPLTSMAVGEFGKISRLLCPLYGSFLVYGFVSKLDIPGLISAEKLIKDINYYIPKS
jgi:3-dehydroquinate dehydratase-1